MEHKAYTRFTVEIGYNDGAVDKVSIETNHAEMDMEEVFNTFKAIALAMSFSPATVDEYFYPCEGCDMVVPPDA